MEISFKYHNIPRKERDDGNVIIIEKSLNFEEMTFVTNNDFMVCGVLLKDSF